MSVVETTVPRRAPGVELLGELRDSGHRQPPSLVRRADGQLVQVTPLLYRLLEALDGERDHNDLADVLTRRTGRRISADQVRTLVDGRLAPLGLVGDAGDPTVPPATPVPLLALRWKVAVTNPRTTARITAPFAILFRRPIVITVLALFALTTWWLLFRHGLASGTRQAFDTPGLLLAAFALVVVSAGWHEFGHAAACRAAGATPGAMGAGVYIVWPAFYTDVDDSRRLDRRGRLTVDLGGLYFNAVAAVAVMAVWAIVRIDALLLVVAAQHILMVRQLPPIIRADGYHILADLVGVPDLFQQLRPTLAGMLPWRWGRQQALRPWARCVIRLWVLVVIPILMWMIAVSILFVPRLAATAWHGAGEQLRALGAAAGDMDVVAMLAAIVQLVALVLPLAAASYLATRVLRRTVGRLWTRTEDHPLARSALAAALALIVAAVALLWWPAGQYEPVGAHERGTVTDLLAMRSPDAGTPIPGVEPVTGYALEPRDGGPTLLLVDHGDGVRGILTDGDRTGVSFPFQLPDPAELGDNQALAINTGDGTVVYEVSVALVWVTDGEPVDNRNEAWALASCTGCTTVAVAFQVVFVIGESASVMPVNAAVAANHTCAACQTVALAAQLVVTLEEMPSDDVKAEIEAAVARLEDLDPSSDPYAAVQEVEREIVTILTDAGLLEDEPVSSIATDDDGGDDEEPTTTTTMEEENEEEDESTTTSTTTWSGSWWSWSPSTTSTTTTSTTTSSTTSTSSSTTSTTTTSSTTSTSTTTSSTSTTTSTTSTTTPS